jgi:peroxiredoxin
MNRPAVFLTCAVLMMASVSSARAQGLLPPPAAASTTTLKETERPLMIGDKVPETLTLADDQSKRRALLSYKSALDVLVVVFFSEPCEATSPLWPMLRRLNDNYKDWRVAFVAIRARPEQEHEPLSAVLQRERLAWPVLRDDRKKAATLFKVTATPAVLIVDEEGILRYRGPVSGAPNALDAIIGHVDEVKDPEP